MEYRYLEYQVSDGYVTKIYNTMPTGVLDGHAIAIADNRNFEEGYEFDNYIVVQEVDTENNLLSSVMIKQPESVKFLRQERDRLLTQNDQLKTDLQATQTAVDFLLMGGM